MKGAQEEDGTDRCEEGPHPQFDPEPAPRTEPYHRMTQEEQEDRYPDDEDQQTDGEAQTGDRPAEIEGAGCQTQQHVEEGDIRSWLCDDAEEGHAFQPFGGSRGFTGGCRCLLRLIPDR